MTVTGVTAGQVTVTWERPSDTGEGGSTITGYEYRDSTDGGSTWQSPDWTSTQGGARSYSFTARSRAYPIP